MSKEHMMDGDADTDPRKDQEQAGSSFGRGAYGLIAVLAVIIGLVVIFAATIGFGGSSDEDDVVLDGADARVEVDDSADSIAATSDNGARSVGEASSVIPLPTQFGPITNMSEIVPLQGTAWVFDEVDGEPQQGAISFAWRGEVEGLVAWFRDECTTGAFATNETSLGGWVIESGPGPNDCQSPLSEIFEDGAIVMMTRGLDTLAFEYPGGSFTADLWESVSVHDEPLIVPENALR